MLLAARNAKKFLGIDVSIRANVIGAKLNRTIRVSLAGTKSRKRIFNQF